MDPADSSRLSRLLDVLDGPDDLWLPEELGAVLRHQLAAPLESDFRTLGATAQEVAAMSPPDMKAKLQNFGDLLAHPHPPLDLLKLTKQFAKSHRNHPESPLPREVATVLYYASIAAAFVRCGERITDLEDGAIRKGFEWCERLGWIDESIRGLIQEAHGRLS